MAIENERKFLVTSLDFKAKSSGSRRIIQGYFDSPDAVAIRIRIADDCAFLTIKGATSGISCSEYEYEIPVVDAQFMLKEFCQERIVEKVRFLVPYCGRIWEVDEYAGNNAGLITAEIELDDPDETFATPAWLGAEISLEPRYKNAALARKPYCKWR